MNALEGLRPYTKDDQSLAHRFYHIQEAKGIDLGTEFFPQLECMITEDRWRPHE